MKKILLGIIAILTYSATFGQSFEGKLIYKVEYDIKTQKIGDFEITQEQIIEKMKMEGEYFDSITVTIKNGNYIKEENSTTGKRLIYRSDNNKIYIFQNDFEYVVITDASKYSAFNLQPEEPKIEKLDSLKTINGINCKLLLLSWGKMGKEYYFYDPETAKLDPELFGKHNFDYLNMVLGITGSYPLEIIKTVSNFVSIKMTLIYVSEEEINDTLFEIPELEMAEKDYYDMMLKITGSEMMKIKTVIID